MNLELEKKEKKNEKRRQKKLEKKKESNSSFILDKFSKICFFFSQFN